jgi:hypothetical protein
MLTVKIQYPSGNDWIIEGVEVTLTPGVTEGGITYPPRVWVKRPDKPEIEQFDEGDIYVMNSAGNTVSVYHLGDKRNAPPSKPD